MTTMAAMLRARHVYPKGSGKRRCAPHSLQASAGLFPLLCAHLGGPEKSENHKDLREIHGAMCSTEL